MHIGMLLFPNLTQLDLTGPYEVLSRCPGATTHLVAHTMDPVVSETGLAILPTATFTSAPTIDLLFVPGGAGQIAAIDDTHTLEWVRRTGATARWITSTCTGALLTAERLPRHDPLGLSRPVAAGRRDPRIGSRGDRSGPDHRGRCHRRNRSRVGDRRLRVRAPSRGEDPAHHRIRSAAAVSLGPPACGHPSRSNTYVVSSSHATRNARNN